jgi:hypothetical protein
VSCNPRSTNATEALDLRTEELPDHVEACWAAIDLVAGFASDALLDALEAELAVLRGVMEVRGLPEHRGP